MKITLDEITYNAGKLERAIPKIIEKYFQTAYRSSAKGAKERIDKGVLTEDGKGLKKSTIAIRKIRGTGGTKPLYETGSLHRSIKGTSEGIEMNHYGIHHHRGFRSKKFKARVPARPFIMPSEKDITPAFERFRKEIRKAFKK